MRKSLALAALCLAAAIGACARHAREDGEWLNYGRTSDEQRFSPLTQIDEKSVARLGLAWSYDVGTLRGLESTPIVHDGVMYVTSAWSLVYAFDARTGRLLWTFDPHVPKDHAKFVCCDVVNRGVVFFRNRVYVGTLDGRLIALEAKSGRLAWDVQTTPKGGPYAITGAPRIARGYIVIGNAGSEYAVRGYISAYDADTGGLVWRTYTVPGDPSKPFESDALRRAAATWSGEWWKGGGGGSPWDAIVYDPNLDLVYFGTGNGSPWYPELRSSNTGDNLYVASIVAVRASNGEQVWHFQTTPNDSWDFDATQPLVLADLTIDARVRRVVMQPNKNGFFYVLDRADGSFISAKPFAHITWATGLDATGRPIEVPAARQLAEATVVEPWTDGAHNWNPISFSARTGLAYMAATDAPTLHAVDRKFVADLHDQTIGRDAGYRGPGLEDAAERRTRGRLVAWDPINQREAWSVDQPAPKSGGTLVTAGNLVFHGQADGKLRAYRATDGTRLWEFDAGVGIAAAPMTFSLAGTQYVAVLAGWGGPMALSNRAAGRGATGFGQLLVFAIGASAALPRYQRSVPLFAPTDFSLPASHADIDEGATLYATFCSRCHGAEVVAGASVPDLRLEQDSTHREWESIVLGGARRQFGMPSFVEDLAPDQVQRIHAYVLDRTRMSVESQ